MVLVWCYGALYTDTGYGALVRAVLRRASGASVELLSQCVEQHGQRLMTYMLRSPPLPP